MSQCTVRKVIDVPAMDVVTGSWAGPMQPARSTANAPAVVRTAAPLNRVANALVQKERAAQLARAEAERRREETRRREEARRNAVVECE